MKKIKFIGYEKEVQAQVEIFDTNIVVVVFHNGYSEFQEYLANGFYADGEDFSDFKTVYKIQDNSIFFSNDDSVFDNTIPDDAKEQMRINEVQLEIYRLKKELAATDYYFVKTLENQILGKEAEYTQEFLQQISAERELVRTKINQLELEIMPQS